MLSAGEADVLVVAKLDRLSRSLLDFAGLMGRSQQEGWSLIALDLGVDTSTAAGEMVAHVHGELRAVRAAVDLGAQLGSAAGRQETGAAARAARDTSSTGSWAQTTRERFGSKSAVLRW